MKSFLVLVTIIFIGASLGSAQPHSKNKDIEMIAAKVAEAYEAGNFGRLDAARLVRGRVRIDLTYYDYGKFKYRSYGRRFRSFKEVEGWFRKQTERFGTSFGQSTFAGCEKGRCDFEQLNGVLHNQFYLYAIIYGYRGNRPFIKALYFSEE